MTFKFVLEDNGHCRVYYRKRRYLYCWQDESSHGSEVWHFYLCSRDGEPSHEYAPHADIPCPGETKVGRDLNAMLAGRDQYRNNSMAMIGSMLLFCALLMVGWLVLGRQAKAESARTYYGSDGRVSGRSLTGSNGSTTFYGSDGRVSGRSTTSSDGTVTVYGADGRKAGSISKPSR